MWWHPLVAIDCSNDKIKKFYTKKCWFRVCWFYVIYESVLFYLRHFCSTAPYQNILKLNKMIYRKSNTCSFRTPLWHMCTCFCSAYLCISSIYIYFVPFQSSLIFILYVSTALLIYCFFYVKCTWYITTTSWFHNGIITTTCFFLQFGILSPLCFFFVLTLSQSLNFNLSFLFVFHIIVSKIVLSLFLFSISFVLS